MRNRFASPALGTFITPDDVRLLDYDQARTLADEIADELRSVNAEINLCRQPGQSRDRLHTLHRRRPFLALLHQDVLRRKAVTRPAAPAASDTPSALPDVAPESDFFVQAARNSLDAATFQRLTLIAAQRRAAELSRLSGMAIDPDHIAA